MVHFEYSNPLATCIPPGSKYKFLPLPFEKMGCMSIALFDFHRFAFFYWWLWTNKSSTDVPDLITFDFHHDLCTPHYLSEIDNLDPDSSFEHSFFSWARLGANNDEQIIAGIYANYINDVYVVCSDKDLFDIEDETYCDKYGKVHTIYKFRNVDDALRRMIGNDVSNLYLDIDLDFFTIENGSTNCDGYISILPDDEISSFLSRDNEYMKFIKHKLKGITVAFEPDFLGGPVESARVYKIFERELFSNSVFNHDTEWLI